jgi:hypothetical protein
MARRLFSMIGTLAMLIAFLPGVVDASYAESLPTCCPGVMCPMHQMAAAQVICNTNFQPRDAALQSCPDQSTHFAAALLFVRVAPSIFFTQRPVDSAALLTPPLAAKINADVPYPPPALWLSS